MNRLSYNNNFNGIIEPGDEFVGAFEESSNHTSLIVNLSITEGTNYSLFIQQSNSNLTPKNNEENISVGQPILLRTKYFRIILKNEEQTNIKIDLHTNLFSQNLTSGSGGGTEVDTSQLATELTVKEIETAVKAIDFHQYESLYKYDLRFLRSQGKCYKKSSYFTISGSLGRLYGSLLNPTDNTYDLYLYKVSMSVYRGPTPDTIAVCLLKKMLFFETTDTAGGMNANLDGISSSAMLTGNNIQFADAGNILAIGLDSSGTGSHTQFFEEYIKIPPGYGVGFWLEAIEYQHQGSIAWSWFEEEISQ